MRYASSLVAALAVVAGLGGPLAAPATGQEWQAARDQFPFVGTRLTIEVDTDAPGTLHVIRGQTGTVRIAGRARDGFTSAGLADGDHLTLAAAGQGPVEFLVTVPGNAWVEVKIPGVALRRGLARGESERWEWGDAVGDVPSSLDEVESPSPATRQSPPTGPPPAPGDALLYTTFTRDVAPLEIDVPELTNVRRITLRLQGYRFKVMTSRPLTVHEGAADRLVIRPVDPPMDIVLAIPASTPALNVRLGGRTALVLDADGVATLCTPVTEQRLSHDRLWFTFNPLDGDLACSEDDVRRHGG